MSGSKEQSLKLELADIKEVVTVSDDSTTVSGEIVGYKYHNDGTLVIIDGSAILYHTT